MISATSTSNRTMTINTTNKGQTPTMKINNYTTTTVATTTTTNNKQQTARTTNNLHIKISI